VVVGLLTRPGTLSSAAALASLYILSRGLILGAALWGFYHIGSGKEIQSGNVQRAWAGSPVLEVGARWDSEWYLLIAERGYHLEEEMAGRRVAYQPADASGFFPLYPLLIRGAARVLDYVPAARAIPVTPWTPRDSAARLPGHGVYLLAATLLSHAALLGAIVLLFLRARETSLPARGTEGAPPHRIALWSCAALLFFPPSLFLSAVYAESLLLLLSLLCFKLLRDRRYLAAAIAGGLASLTKPTGLLLVLPGTLAAIRGGSDRTKPGFESSMARWLALPIYLSGVAGFSLYCSRAFGDPLSWLHRQSRWRGGLSGPWRAFTRWAEHPQIHGAHGSTVELVFALLVLALLAVVFLRRPIAESAYAGAVALPPLCSTLWSYGRLSLQAFPLFIALGGIMARRPAVAALYIAIGAAGSAALAAYFGAWYWAG